jgi:hypothetical protein
MLLARSAHRAFALYPLTRLQAEFGQPVPGMQCASQLSARRLVRSCFSSGREAKVAEGQQQTME